MLPARLPRGLPPHDGRCHHRRPGPLRPPAPVRERPRHRRPGLEGRRRGPGRPPRDPRRRPTRRGHARPRARTTTSSTASTTADDQEPRRDATTADERRPKRHEDGGAGFAHPLSSGWQMEWPLLRPLTISSIGETSRRAPAIRGAADGRATRRLAAPTAVRDEHGTDREGRRSSTGRSWSTRSSPPSAPVPPGVLRRRHRRRRGPRRPPSSTPTRTSSWSASTATTPPSPPPPHALAPLRPTGSRSAGPASTNSARSSRSSGMPAALRRPVRPRGVLAPARPRRAGASPTDTKDHSTCDRTDASDARRPTW